MHQYNLNNELCVIEVSGDDSRKFLQGQLTNDINALDHQAFQLSAHLNNKGRMLASFIITRTAAERYYLITATEIADKIIPRLRMFVLRSKVSITRSDLNIILTDAKTDNTPALQIAPGYFLLPSQETPQDSADSSSIWRKILIDHGIAMIYPATQEQFIPQHVNYDLAGGVNYKKGCYTGQEIVARTHYLGKVKQRMFKFTSGTAALIGQKVVSPDFGNQEVGAIVDVINQDNAYIGLVSIKADCSNNVFLDADNRHQLNTQEINYPESEPH